MKGESQERKSMNERLPQLLAWFDRVRGADPFDIPPVVVTRKRAREARQYLREHSGFDFEAFEKNAGVEQLLHEPLGETAECLSAEDIAGVVHSHLLESPETLDALLIARVVSHVEDCETCFQNIEIYQEMERRSLARASMKGVENLPAARWIDAVGRVEMIGRGEPMLGLSLMMPRHSAGVESISAMKCRVSFPFQTEEMMLYPVEGTVQTKMSILPKRIAEWMRSIKEPPEGLVRNHYRTDRFIGLEKAENVTCGFLSVSQEIGGEEIYSTRIVRLEKSQNLTKRTRNLSAGGSSERRGAESK
jgi:hypothetical protein